MDITNILYLRPWTLANNEEDAQRGAFDSLTAVH